LGVDDHVVATRRGEAAQVRERLEHDRLPVAQRARRAQDALVLHRDHEHPALGIEAQARWAVLDFSQRLDAAVEPGRHHQARVHVRKIQAPAMPARPFTEPQPFDEHPRLHVHDRHGPAS
jgi:hypothetical protein